MAESWFLVASTKSPGRGLDGRRQVIFRENRYWTNTITMPELWGLRANAWQAMIDDLIGMSGILRLPVLNSGAFRFRGDLGAFYALFSLTPTQITSGLPFDDDTTFDDGAGCPN